MLWRNLWAEAIDFLDRPLQWLGIIIVSLSVLVGVDQLALDNSTVKVRIVDDDPDQKNGRLLLSLINELSGVDPVLSEGFFDKKVTEAQADIIIHKVDGLWHGTLRPRSILDHRRLARVGFSLATIINRLSPWDTVMSAESMSRRDYRQTICDVGERMCSVLNSIGDPQYNAACQPASPYRDNDNSKDRACPNNSKPVIKDALALDFRLGKFCSPDVVDVERSKGLCVSTAAPTLGSVVSMLSAPQSHTRIFISRTICLISVFVSFVVCCRGWMQETRYNTWPVIAAISHGNINTLIVAKIAISASFVLLLAVVLLEFSSWEFGIGIKPGLLISLLPLSIAATSSAMLGLAIALVVRSEISSYVIASFYLLVLFVLSGYIDDLKGTMSGISVAAYVLPLRYIIAPLSSWMTFGVVSPLEDSVVPLLAQCMGSFALLLVAKLIHQRRI